MSSITDQPTRRRTMSEIEQRARELLAPAEGEEIMVNTPYDVFILPLQPSGLSSGPRFVVHVPGPEQPAPQAQGEPVDDDAGKDFFIVPEGLHPNTVNLVARFATALAEKLAAAERKYGYSDNWAHPDWMDECRQELIEHIAKGDPRDVAAYCAFLWHHGESTAGAKPDAVAGEHQ